MIGLEALHHPRIELAKIDISAEGKHDIAYMPFYKTKQYAAIEKELKEKDDLKQNLDKLADDFNYMSKNYQELQDKKKQYEQCYIIKRDRAIKEAQKNKQVLDIIKEKVIPLVHVYDNMVYDNEEYEHKELTSEEFNLLKGWLER